MALAQYDYTIMSISSERNCWVDLLSRWVNVQAVAVQAVTMFAISAPGEIIPSTDAICQVQQQTKAGLGAMVSGASSFTAPVGRATKYKQDLFCVGLDGQEMLWIPEHAKKMEMRLMVCTHMKDAGHRGVVSTSQWLQEYC